MDTLTPEYCNLLVVGGCFFVGMKAGVQECIMKGHRAYYHIARKDQTEPL